jgi:hypothetical protein
VFPFEVYFLYTWNLRGWVEGEWDVDLAINPRTGTRPGAGVVFEPILAPAFVAVLVIVIVFFEQTIDRLQSLPGQDRIITPFSPGILLPQVLVLRIKPGRTFSPPTCC